MDLSAVIFVVLAIGWAVYLIPKALQHHDEMAGERLVEGHSDDVRVLSRPGRQTPVREEQVADQPDIPSGARVVTAPVPTLAAARRAARNRRRVLGVLTLALAVVAGLAGFGLAPWWSTAIPAGLIVVFLVVARVSVRRTQRARRAAAPGAVAPVTLIASPSEEIDAAAEDLDEDAEDTVGVPRQELEAALADEGSLWDPLPVTLPTYVGKARARRTVRTIELTGINSSGHDETDSALAREAQATAATQAAEDDLEAEQRRVAGA